MGSPSAVSLGALSPWSNWGKYNSVMFAVMQAIAKLQTATLVRVEACSNSGDLSPVGTVDITPLVNQVDGLDNAIPHVTIYGVPYLRIQGGQNAVIMDPQKGDIGLAVFGSRDLSKVIAAKTQANPGSLRQYDFQDALYVGGMLNGVPTQVIQFASTGIVITAPNGVTINGALTVTGDVTANGVSLHSHIHGGVQTGSGDTSQPL